MRRESLTAFEVLSPKCMREPLLRMAAQGWTFRHQPTAPNISLPKPPGGLVISAPIPGGSDEAFCFPGSPTCERRRPGGGFVSCGNAPGDDFPRAGDAHETPGDACETRLPAHETAGDTHETPFRAHETVRDACETRREAHEGPGDGCEIAWDCHESLRRRHETALRAHETRF